MIEFTLTIVGFGLLGLAYGSVLTTLCSRAYFAEKLKYQRSFFLNFDGTRKSNLGG